MTGKASAGRRFARGMLVTGLMLSQVAWAAGPNLCQGISTDLNDHPMPLNPRPQKGVPFQDPRFHTRVVRITDVQVETGKAGVRKPMYPTVAAWNADESLMILYQTAGLSGSGLPSQHLLYDGKTYRFRQVLEISPSDLEHIYWDAKDPDVLYYPSIAHVGGKAASQLIRYTVSTGIKEVLADFPECAAEGKLGFGHPKYMAWNGTALGLRCTLGGDRGARTTSFNLVTRKAGDWVEDRNGGGLQVAPSGKLAVRGSDIIDLTRGMTPVRRMKGKWDEHATLAPLANGNDAQVSSQFDVKPFGNIVVENLNTGEVKVVIGPDKGHGYPRTGSHVSTVAWRAPGWVAVSMVGKLQGEKFFDQEIALANIDTGVVCRVAHHHSSGRAGPQKYWAEPQVVISPSGDRMLFSSDWHGSPNVDTYVIELPIRQKDR